MGRQRGQGRVRGHAGFVFLLALVLGLGSIWLGLPQKWDAAEFWTLVTFAGVIELCRRKWMERVFWAKILAILAVHVVAMWVIFSHITGKGWVPLIITLPLIWLEVTIILKLVHVRETSGNHRAPVG